MTDCGCSMALFAALTSPVPVCVVCARPKAGHDDRYLHPFDPVRPDHFQDPSQVVLLPSGVIRAS